MKKVCILFLNLLSVFCIADIIPLRYIGGRVCIQGEIAAGQQRMPVHLVVDLGAMYPLILDKEALSAFELGKDDRFAVTLSTSARLENLTYQSADLSSLRTFTKDYAVQLKEIPVIGVIGLPAFDQNAVLLDIGKSILEYGDVVRAGDDWQSMRLIQTESGYRIAVNPAEDYTLQAGFITSSYETWIDSVCASIAGFPGGNFPRMMMGPINVSDFTAIRPAEFDSSNHPDAMIGNSFWQNFEVIVETASQTIWLRDKKNRLSDLGEQAYFMALVDDDPNAIENYIDHNSSSRLIAEAIEVLLDKRLSASVLDKQVIARACKQLIRYRSSKDAAEMLIGFADKLFEQKRYENNVIELLLEQAKACCLKDTDALMLGYEAMGRAGRYALIKKDLAQARLSLLSALFGQPANPSFNYWMGQYYEASGQLVRAWSRYLKAVLCEHPVSEASSAIGKLNNNPAFRAGFSMLDAQEFMDGYIPVYNPADLPEKLHSPLTLIEAFTCGDDAASSPLEMTLQAMEGLDGVMIANYHIGKPAAEPLENQASQAAFSAHPFKSTPALVINGFCVEPNQMPLLNPSDIAKGLAAFRPANQPVPLPIAVTPSSGKENTWRITVSLEGLKEVARGEILLVEQRCMLFSSTQTVMFRNVVRASLFNQNIKSSDTSISTELDFNKIQSDNMSYLKSIQDSQKFAFNMIPAYIDPGMSFVIAKVYGANGQLIAAAKQALGKTRRDDRAR